MGYTQLTHGYRLDLNPSPECGDCGARLTVDHLLWDCLTSRRQRMKCNITKETLSGDEDEIRRLIRDEMNSKEITNIRKRKWQTNGMGTRKILDDTMTNGHGKWTPKV
jgi:hypothetical protein